MLAVAQNPAPAAGPVQRCVTDEGRTLYTDRRCADLGAVDRVPPPRGTAATDGRLQRIGCARTLGALAGEVGAAVRAGDVNRLAGVYDWAGVSNASASRILDRLEAVVARPLVDVAPVMAADPAEGTGMPVPGDGNLPAAQGALLEPAPASPAWMPNWPRRTDPPPAPVPAEAATAAIRATTTRPRPVGLRLEQTLAGGATPMRTVFGLRRNFGCLWIAL
ncbi:hypothetical protein B1992_09715 [Pseudoxanthomonas broegbernensis]|uniref:DUF4124 domain-containing protein n=2 Tax=Pseudoxanthomonas broegbernensis TaxID=83619 RepID=A0A7V8GM18_9GAMM|nr:hypothetical protein B1992_09715 [Pseudoxanthomonas broegbernensis]